ncbi:hypothetical protein CDV55_102018 [Aspergillus turcosus]|nr:hypothetical protein CDV55_102018 [Aspergillus turcosus]
MEQIDGAAKNEDENKWAIEILVTIQEAKAVHNDPMTVTDGDVSDSGPSQKPRETKTFNTIASGWFGRVVADEGHAAKTIRTRVHQSVAQLNADVRMVWPRGQLEGEVEAVKESIARQNKIVDRLTGVTGQENQCSPVSAHTSLPSPAFCQVVTVGVAVVERLAEAYYLMSDTAKLRYIFRILWKEGLWREPEADARRPRFLLFVHWPMVVWLTEMFLNCLGIRYVTIRAQKTDSAQREAAEQFTKPDSTCDVLLISYQRAHGLNLPVGATPVRENVKPAVITADEAARLTEPRAGF